jgi:hypothetical protein
MALNNSVNFPKARAVVPSSPQQMDNNTCYLLDDPGHTTIFTLPVLSEMGDMLHFCCMSATSFIRINQNADQYMVATSSTSPKKTTIGTAGYVSGGGSNYYSYYSLMCIEANKGWMFTGWQSISSTGFDISPSKFLFA